MQNRNGEMVSPQVSVMGAITLDKGKGFKREDVGFNIKNDGESAVVLDVRLVGMPEGEFVKTRFDVGWNPEIVQEIKATSIICDLKYGY